MNAGVACNLNCFSHDKNVDELMNMKWLEQYSQECNKHYFCLLLVLMGVSHFESSNYSALNYKVYELIELQWHGISKNQEEGSSHKSKFSLLTSTTITTV